MNSEETYNIVDDNIMTNTFIDESDDGWTVVKKKQRNRVKQVVEEEVEIESTYEYEYEDKRYIRVYEIPPGYRRFCEKDYCLTKREQDLIKNKMDEDEKNGCKWWGDCKCCNSGKISEILRRPFYSCGKCYCCAGDDPTMDGPDLRIYIDDTTGAMYCTSGTKVLK